MAISQSTTSTAESPATFASRRLTVGDFRVTRERPWSPLPSLYRSSKPNESPRGPSLRVRGRWLEKAGFAIGAKVLVTVSQGYLVLEAVADFPGQGRPASLSTAPRAVDGGRGQSRSKGPRS